MNDTTISVLRGIGTGALLVSAGVAGFAIVSSMTDDFASDEGLLQKGLIATGVVGGAALAYGVYKALTGYYSDECCGTEIEAIDAPVTELEPSGATYDAEDDEIDTPEI
jgi:hypothetical protein